MLEKKTTIESLLSLHSACTGDGRVKRIKRRKKISAQSEKKNFFSCGFLKSFKCQKSSEV
jgi:hypothetical protein